MHNSVYSNVKLHFMLQHLRISTLCCANYVPHLVLKDLEEKEHIPPG